MAAYRLHPDGARVEEVARPTPGADEVLVRVAGAGLCGTDLHFISHPEAVPYSMPFTLGHETAGWVEAAGPEVEGIGEGDAVIVAAGSFCGRCRYCRYGHTNYCTRGPFGRGFGEDGGIADYVTAPQREVVRLTKLDPTVAGPLADAGGTSYHAVQHTLPKLVPGSTAVVIAVGGLGSYAVQYLRLLSAARIIAVDARDHRLDLARERGAHETVRSDDRLVERVHELTGGEGVEVVFDFVGLEATATAAAALVRPRGTVALVGGGGGSVVVGRGPVAVAAGAEVFAPIGSSIAQLHEIVGLAESGQLVVDAELFAFDQIDVGFARLRAGELRARAVVTPGR